MSGSELAELAAEYRRRSLDREDGGGYAAAAALLELTTAVVFGAKHLGTGDAATGMGALELIGASGADIAKALDRIADAIDRLADAHM
jgi:hypothetical protein